MIVYFIFFANCISYDCYIIQKLTIVNFSIIVFIFHDLSLGDILHAHLVSKAGSVIRGKSPLPVLKWSRS